MRNSFTAFFFIIPYVLFRVKHAALQGVEGIGLFSIWRVFAIYQIIRSAMWLLRIRLLSERLNNMIVKAK